ncbi:MAG: transposase family protein [Bacteroidia bacterium]|nr:transposase family protein [Bacteroidia bacterium]
MITAPHHIVLSAANEFKRKTTFVNEMWQTDFSYFRITGWGNYYMSSVMDDYSRFLIVGDLLSTMKAEDARATIDKAIISSGISPNKMPKLLSDNGSCYIAQEFRAYLKLKGIHQINGAPCHPQTQGKIERYHRTIKNVVLLENYYSPEELQRAITKFVHYYNYERYHESLDNMTPADVYFGRAEKVRRNREKIKRETMFKRKEDYFKQKLILEKQKLEVTLN